MKRGRGLKLENAVEAMELLAPVRETVHEHLLRVEQSTRRLNTSDALWEDVRVGEIKELRKLMGMIEMNLILIRKNRI